MSNCPNKTQIRQKLQDCSHQLVQVSNHIENLWRKASNDRLDACYLIVIESIHQQVYEVAERIEKLARTQPEL